MDNEGRKQEYYETITNESEHLSRLIDNILDFSRIEAGMKEYRFSDTDMEELARGVASQFQEQAAQAGFMVKSQISDQMPEASVDRAAISQALFNLLDNAIKYSGTPGKAGRYSFQPGLMKTACFCRSGMKG